VKGSLLSADPLYKWKAKVGGRCDLVNVLYRKARASAYGQAV
jgi:hypothetical protein